jgi:AsmA protein
MAFVGKLVKLIILLAILGLIAGVAVILLVNPNSFKPQISKIINNYTGQTVIINGPIKWSIRPETMLNLQDVVINKSADDQTPILAIKDVTAYFDLVSFIGGNLIVHDLELTNVNLDWTTVKNIVANQKDSNSGRKFIVETLKVKNGDIKLQDKTDNLNFELQNINATARSVILNSGQPIPSINVQADLVNLDKNSTYNIDTTVKIDPAKQSISLDSMNISWGGVALRGNALIEQYSTDPVVNGTIAINNTSLGDVLKKIDPYFANSKQEIKNTLQVQLAYSYATKDQVLDMSQLNFQIDSGELSGNIKLGFAKPYHAEFALAANNLDLQPVGLFGSALIPSLHTMKQVPIEVFRDMTINGKFSGTKLAYGDLLALDQIQMQVVGQGGIIQLTPVIIGAYGGMHNISLNIDLISKKLPFIQLNEQADKVAIDPWMKLLNEKSIITGSASIKASLETVGSDVETLKQNLSGGVNININDGTLYGFDANQLMQFTTQTVTNIFNELSTSPTANLTASAVKRSSDWINTQQGTPSTKFDTFQFNADINQGVSKKASINMGNSAIILKGAGNFSLIDNTIHFDATLSNRGDINSNIKSLATFMQKSPIAIAIDGTFGKPIYGPSVQSYVLNVLKLAQTDITNQAISKMVSVTPPNAKTDKTATDLFLDSLQSLR